MLIRVEFGCAAYHLTPAQHLQWNAVQGTPAERVLERRALLVAWKLDSYTSPRWAKH